MSGRRLQTHGGTVHETKGLLQTPLPAWLSRLTARLAADTSVYGVDADGRPKQPNHVLINAYTAGQGIMVSYADVTPRKNAYACRFGWQHAERDCEATSAGTSGWACILSRRVHCLPGGAGGDALPHQGGRHSHWYATLAVQALSRNVCVNDRRPASAVCGCAEPLRPGMVATSVALHPRSLLVFKDEAYTAHLHGIDEVRRR